MRGDSPDGRTSVEAGAGRPFRFSLELEPERGLLLCWLGGKWSLILGIAVVGAFAAAGGIASGFQPTPLLAPEVFVCAAAAMGCLAVALYLRPRRVQFQRREGTWWWRERRPVGFAAPWSAITEEAPLRLEREILSTVEGFALYAGPVRLLSYLGDPSIGRSVGRALESAGVPLRVVVKRARGEE